MQNAETIKINDNFHLTPAREADKADFVKYLNDPEIYKYTLSIPYPYTEKDADLFIEYCNEKTARFGREMEWRIHDSKSGEAIGGIGLHGKYGKDSHRDEIGYWVARHLWGKGIMTAALKALTQFVFENYNLDRIEAPIYSFNIGSQRAAEKAGFQKEGVLRKAYKKDGKYFDGVLYSLIKEN